MAEGIGFLLSLFELLASLRFALSIWLRRQAASELRGAPMELCFRFENEEEKGCNEGDMR